MVATDSSFPGHLYSIAPFANLTGAPISSMNHIRRLARHFAAAKLVLPENGKLQERAQAAGVSVLTYPIAARGLRRNIFRKTLIADLWAVIRSRGQYFLALCREFRRNPGIVHVQSSITVGPMALLAARICGMPSVIHYREPARPSLAGRLHARILTMLATRVVFVSKGIQQGYSPAVRRRSRVIYNYMDVGEPRTVSAVRDRPLIVMAARMGSRKGADIFLETCRAMHQRGDCFEAWMVGGWNIEHERIQARDFLDRHGLSPVVLDCGDVPDMDRVYHQADILVLTARRDPFPRVIMEAMCQGIPVVAARVDGIPEMVEDGVTGILVEPENVAGFAAALERLLENPELRHQMGEAGRERARQIFSPEAYESAMLALYREIAKSS